MPNRAELSRYSGGALAQGRGPARNSVRLKHGVFDRFTAWEATELTIIGTTPRVGLPAQNPF